MGSWIGGIGDVKVEEDAGIPDEMLLLMSDDEALPLVVDDVNEGLSSVTRLDPYGEKVLIGSSNCALILSRIVKLIRSFFRNSYKHIIITPNALLITLQMNKLAKFDNKQS